MSIVVFGDAIGRQQPQHALAAGAVLMLRPGCAGLAMVFLLRGNGAEGAGG